MGLIFLVRVWGWNSEVPQIPTDDLITGYINSEDVTYLPLAMNMESQRKDVCREVGQAENRDRSEGERIRESGN